MKTKVRAIALLAAIGMFGAVAVSQSQEKPKTSLQPKQIDRALLFASNADIAEGETLANEACASCHGVHGFSEDSNLPHVAGQHVIYLYNELHAYKNGLREDTSMGKAVQFLSDDAMRKVSAYYSSQVLLNLAAATPTEPKPAPVPASNPVELGKAAAAACGGCHGADGNSMMPGMPNLTAQPVQAFKKAMADYKNGSRKGTMMTGFAATVSDEALQNMGMYYGLQAPKATANAGSGDADAGATKAEACSSCHGEDGNTTRTDLPTLAGQDATYLVSAMKAYAKGLRENPQMLTATEKLSDDDLNDLAAFYAQQEPIAHKVRIPPTVADWIHRCDRCHGLGGNSTEPRMPSLAGQNAAYLTRVMKIYANGGRHNSMMSAMARPLSESDIEALSAHYASQIPRSILYVELPCTLPTEE